MYPSHDVIGRQLQWKPRAHPCSNPKKKPSAILFLSAQFATAFSFNSATFSDARNAISRCASLARAEQRATIDHQTSDFAKFIVLLSRRMTAMLVFTRKTGEKIHIGSDITITVVSIGGNKLRIGIEAPEDITILRAELNDFLEIRSVESSKPPLSA